MAKLKAIDPYSVLVEPHMTEKSTRVSEASSQFAFKVNPKAGKVQIKRAMKLLFGVKVKRVNTLQVAGKVRRTKFGQGRRARWKKAYITLQEGETLNLTGLDKAP